MSDSTKCKSDDTVKLLRECNAGIKMGVNTIEQVCDKISDNEFKNILNKSKEEHQRLGSRTHELLNRYGTEGKEPQMMARMMSHIKSEVLTSVKDTDSSAADLITDGCNMGVKSLNRYLNKYKNADKDSVGIAKELIAIEDKLLLCIRKYL